MPDLTLKWRRSAVRPNDSFLGFDPERYEDIEVVGIHESYRSATESTVWTWQIYIVPTTPYAAQLHTRNGQADTPREAAAAAEACYRRFVEVMPADVLAADLAHKKHNRAMGGEWARKHGPKP